MVTRHAVKLTAHFERNLEAIETFLTAAEAPQAFDALLAELSDTVIPNLQRYPAMGRLFLERPARSVEVATGIERLKKQLRALDPAGEPREYVLADYLLLYVRIEGAIYMLSIRHHRELSFDLAELWLV